MKRLHVEAAVRSLAGLAIMCALLFIPAGSLRWWQGWLLVVVFTLASSLITVYLALRDPRLLERRLRAGPTAEKEPAQKRIMTVAMSGFVLLLVLPGLDRRYGWSQLPDGLALLGDALVALSFVVFYRVVRVNSSAAATVRVEEGQQVVSTGPYAVVRHPMYAGVLPMVAGMPLALGSWWGMAPGMLVMLALVRRLLHEERFLAQNLPGYAEYCRRVHYRLLPGVW
ncbi:MAG TPA: isoprenylcysteine carboxylmethyltransferase family protein [Nevskia sp.]|nr:isoprenylcysteine carboxylmethyltransferase family protein [Nevskia sp.]